LARVISSSIWILVAVPSVGEEHKCTKQGAQQMPRQRVYPRFVLPDGTKKLLLTRRRLVVDLSDAVPEELTITDIQKSYRRMQSLVENTRDFYKIETRRNLYVYKEEDGWVWCTDDIQRNVSEYVWLRKKADKLASGIIELLKQELIDAKVRHEGSPTVGDTSTDKTCET
jgi:hypothetical protein